MKNYNKNKYYMHDYDHVITNTTAKKQQRREETEYKQ